jgi:hypothetical protein
MNEMKTEDLFISFAAALIVTFLLGFIVGGIIGLIAIAIVYMVRDPKVFPTEFFIGGGIGLVIGAICAVLFAFTLL